MNKRGDKVLSVYWFIILFVVAGAVIYMAYIFYGSPYDVRTIESTALGDQIADCITSEGYLNDSIFSSDFSKNFVSYCHLNFNVEDVYDWKNQTQYYAEIGVYKFDPNSFSLTGRRLVNISLGNANLKTAWQLNSISQSQKSSGALHTFFSSASSFFTRKRKVTIIVIHSTEGSRTEGALETIEGRELSIHYIIDKNGNVMSSENALEQYRDAFVPENRMASHAGCGVGDNRLPICTSSSGCIDSNGLLDDKCQQLSGIDRSQWCCIPNFNPKSIGIELVNLGDKCTSYPNSLVCKGNSVVVDGERWENFSEAQINSLVTLVSGIASKYNIPLNRDHIIGHYQITTYKTDPGPAFPWDEFMKKLQEEKMPSLRNLNKNLPQGRKRSFYVLDKDGNQYIVNVLAIVRKTEKNVV